MRKTHLLKGLLTGLLALALVLGVFGLTGVSADEEPTPAPAKKATFTCGDYSYEVEVTAAGQKIKVDDILANLSKGTGDSAEKIKDVVINTNTVANSLTNCTLSDDKTEINITALDNASATIVVAPKMVPITFVGTAATAETDEVVLTGYKYIAEVENGKQTKIPASEIAIGMTKYETKDGKEVPQEGKEAETALGYELVVETLAAIDGDNTNAAIARQTDAELSADEWTALGLKYITYDDKNDEYVVNLAYEYDTNDNAKKTIVTYLSSTGAVAGTVKGFRAFIPSYDLMQDAIAIKTHKEEQAVYYADVKTSDGKEIKGSAYKTAKAANNEAVIVLNDKSKGFKQGENKALYLNLTIRKPVATEKMTPGCNFTLDATEYKAVTAGIDYSKAAAEKSDVCAISSIQVKVDKTVTTYAPSAVAAEQTAFEEKLAALVYSVDQKTWFKVFGNELATSGAFATTAVDASKPVVDIKETSTIVAPEGINEATYSFTYLTSIAAAVTANADTVKVAKIGEAVYYKDNAAIVAANPTVTRGTAEYTYYASLDKLPAEAGNKVKIKVEDEDVVYTYADKVEDDPETDDNEEKAAGWYAADETTLLTASSFVAGYYVVAATPLNWGAAISAAGFYSAGNEGWVALADETGDDVDNTKWIDQDGNVVTYVAGTPVDEDGEELDEDAEDDEIEGYKNCEIKYVVETVAQTSVKFDRKNTAAFANLDTFTISVKNNDFNGTYLASLCAKAKADKLFFRLNGSEEKTEGTTVTPAKRCAKAKKVAIAVSPKLKAVKADFTKGGTIAIKNGFDYYVSAEKDLKNIKLSDWTTILPYNKQGTATAAKVAGDTYVPFAKCVDAGTASFTTTKVKNVAIADICKDLWDAGTTKVYIYVRKSATAKKPASAFVVAGGKEITKPAAAPVITAKNGVFASDAAKQDNFVVPAIKNAAGDTAGASYEFCIINKSDLAKFNAADAKWTKLVAGKAFKMGAKSTYTIDNAKTTAALDSSSTYILVRRAATKGSALASEYAVTEIRGGKETVGTEQKDVNQWVPVA